MSSPNGGASDWTGVTPHFAVGETVARRYRIEQLVRQDLFGSVYRARHTRYGQALLLKVFHPFLFGSDEDFSRVRKSFDDVKALRHAGIVRYLEVGEVDDIRYITMDQVDGKSLRQLLDEYLHEGQVLSLAEAKRFILQILGILQELPEKTHGNLNPDNIILPARIRPGLMGETSDIRLIDFALVDVNAMATGDLQLAPPEALAYTGPELVQYGSPPTQAIDVFAVAAIFYEMLTGSRPVGQLVMPSKLRPDVPEEYDFLFEACLKENPAERINTIQEMESRLANLSEEVSEISVKTPQRSAAWLLAGVVVLAAAGGAWYATQDIELSADAKIQNESVELVNAARDGAINQSKEDVALWASAAPKGMAYVPPGKFVRGYLPNERLKSAKTQERLLSGLEGPGEVAELGAFYIDRYDAPNQKGALPTVDISWDNAKAACTSQGKRLCSADEWERACKGGSSFNYPYGMDYQPTACPPSKMRDYKLGDYEGCESGFKVRDMVGATWEWTDTASPEGDFGHIIKGGYPGSDAGGHRCAFRHQENNEATYRYLSFRCCMDLPAEPPALEDKK